MTGQACPPVNDPLIWIQYYHLLCKVWPNHVQNDRYLERNLEIFALHWIVCFYEVITHLLVLQWVCPSTLINFSFLSTLRRGSASDKFCRTSTLQVSIECDNIQNRTSICCLFSLLINSILLWFEKYYNSNLCIPLPHCRKTESCLTISDYQSRWI